MESSEAQRQESSAPSIGEEAEVADADETLGEHVKQETPQELIAREGHQFLPIMVGHLSRKLCLDVRKIFMRLPQSVIET